MTYHCFIILSLFLPLPCVNAQTPSCKEECCLGKVGRGVHAGKVGSHVEDMELQIHSNLQNPNTEVTTDLRSWHSRTARHHRRHLRNVRDKLHRNKLERPFVCKRPIPKSFNLLTTRNFLIMGIIAGFSKVHGILNIMGWGTFLPIGVIIARYYRKLPLKCNEWYSLHVSCQTSGFILGTIGWSIGMWLGNASKHHTPKTHRILSTIVFTLATTQMFAICLQPKEDNKFRKYWEMYHRLLGYALIALIIANIFQGINNQRPAEKWKWPYVGVLGVLASTAGALEIFTWIKSINRRAVMLNNNSHASS